MKKTIFSGLLVITLLVFASCVPYEGQVNATQLQETLEGTYTLNFTVETSNNVKATNADPKTAIDEIPFKFYLEPNYDNRYKMIAKLYDWPNDYDSSGDGNFVYFDDEPEFTINYDENTVSFIFNVNYQNLNAETYSGLFRLKGDIINELSNLTLEGTPTETIKITYNGFDNYVNKWIATKD
ncbi:hypothetical protein [Geotoga petraea]|uniref:Lipocalin-like domain-containing protein n=1 Tax=Geotoga petraea TaxID=28234 RepID=A0A1G6JQ65_9BACT|nr:hypothetical protein [Geotoga petraea]SDC20869.1 hypothetical protein SAMN04488588_0599 [Geotoga petraea]